MKKDKNLKTKIENKVPFYKKNKFKFSTLSTVIVAIFLVCLILVNVLATFLSERFTSFSIDMTSSADFTISDTNREYIEKIDKPVSVIFTCTEEYYLSEYLTYMSQYYSDSSGGKYYKQTIELLKNYQKINPNISVQFIDATTPDFNKYKERYGSSDINLGDIIVDYTYENEEGVEKTKFKVLGFDDLYVIEENSDYSAYTSTSYGTISGSSVETSVTSALYYVTKEQEDKIAVITGYGSSDISSYLESLEISGYDYVEISDLEFDDIPEDATMVMIAAPTLDFTESDVKKLDEFLLGKAGDKDFSYQKSLIYFASSSQADTPNLDGLLEDWGITFDIGTVYETDSSKHAASSNTVILLSDAESEFSEGINSNLSYITDNLRPMKIKFESSGKYNTYEVLKSSDTCVVKPFKSGDSWNPDAENQSSYSSVVLSRYVTENPDKDNEPRFSNVLAVGSIDFISDTYTEGSYLANDELMLSLINTCAGRVSETYEIDNKEIADNASFEPTETQAAVIEIIVSYLIPILVIVMGIVLFVVRKRR